LYIEDPYGSNAVLVASKSMYQIGSAIDECGNDSFEEDPTSAWQSAGYHYGYASAPLSIPSWSLQTTGNISHSITNRVSMSDADKAVSGDYSFDLLTQHYTSSNTYELTQIVTASSHPSTI